MADPIAITSGGYDYARYDSNVTYVVQHGVTSTLR